LLAIVMSLSERGPDRNFFPKNESAPIGYLRDGTYVALKVAEEVCTRATCFQDIRLQRF